MYVFDRGDAGTVAFRDLLIAFSLTMKGDEMEKLEWMYKVKFGGKFVCLKIFFSDLTYPKVSRTISSLSTVFFE